MNNWGGKRKGSGRKKLDEREKKKGVKIYITEEIKDNIEKLGKGDSFSEKTVEIIISEIENRKLIEKNKFN